MKITRVHSDGWIFDGAEFHRAAADRSENEKGPRFHPRVDVRHLGNQHSQKTYKMAPGPDDQGFPTLKEALVEAEKGRNEWERGRGFLYPAPPLEQTPHWSEARDKETEGGQNFDNNPDIDMDR